MDKLPFQSREVASSQKPRVYRTAFVHPIEVSRREHHVLSDKSDRTQDQLFAEGVSLVKAAGFELVCSRQVRLPRVSPSSYLGSGSVEDLSQEFKHTNVAVVVINTRLSGIQQRTLEERWQVKVIDRMGLILRIFEKRARSSEGKLQVELAQALYARSRLVRTWTHLERQRGGGGFLAGPGEKQLEIDKRLLNTKCLKLQKDLLTVRKTRSLQRSSRKKTQKPVVALVGYTNAGKSTLFNRLTGADVMADDMVFATLDPTVRCITLPSKKEIFLFDTVGFISNLPHELVDSFRATLEEITQADLILHVRDGASEETEAQALDVHNILFELPRADGVEVPILEIMNKSDLSSGLRKAKEGSLQISALSGEGCNRLLEKIEESLGFATRTYSFKLSLGAGSLVAWLHAHGLVLNEKETNGSLKIQVKLTVSAFKEFEKCREAEKKKDLEKTAHPSVLSKKQ